MKRIKAEYRTMIQIEIDDMNITAIMNSEVHVRAGDYISIEHSVDDIKKALEEIQESGTAVGVIGIKVVCLVKKSMTIYPGDILVAKYVKPKQSRPSRIRTLLAALRAPRKEYLD